MADEYTDEELFAMAGIEPGASAPSSSFDYTDDELFAAAGIKPKETSYRDLALGGLKGIAKAGTDVLTAPADLLFRGGNALINAIPGVEDVDPTGGYPSDRVSQFLDYISGGEGSKTAEDITQGVGNLATIVAVPSQANKLASKIPFLSSVAKGKDYVAKGASALAGLLGLGAEGAGYSILSDRKEPNIFQNAGTGAAINTAIPVLGKTIGKGKELIFGGGNAVEGAQKIAKTLQEEIGLPRLFKASTVDDEIKAAGSLFNDIPSEPVNLDGAVNNISQFVEKTRGVIDPKGTTARFIDYLKGLKPKDELVSTPASKILDASGKPIVEATSKVVPGGPATLTLPQAQNFLRDLRAYGQGAEGVPKAILAKTREEVLDAIEKGVSPEALDKFKGARKAYSLAMKEADKEELLFDMFKGNKTPVTWGGYVSRKVDDFHELFGKDVTEKLREALEREGSIGSKLLQDNKGLISLFAKFAGKTLVGGALGSAAGGIIPGDSTSDFLIGAALGASGQKGQGAKVAKMRELLMNAATKSERAMAILATPVTKAKYLEAIGRLGAVILSEFNQSNKTPKKDTQVSKTVEKPQSPLASNSIFNKKAVLDAVRQVESNGNSLAISPKGAQGVMQIMPDTAQDILRSLNLDPTSYDPRNEELQRQMAEHYLFDMIPKMLPEGQGTLDNLLAAYNAGPGAVTKYLKGQGNLPSETMAYIPKVKSLM